MQLIARILIQTLLNHYPTEMPSQSLNILEYTRPHGNEQPLTEDAIPSFLKAFTYEFVSPTPTPRICSHKTTNETVQYKTEGPNRGRTLVNVSFEYHRTLQIDIN